MSGMYYNHGAVDGHVASFGSITSGIDQNNQALASLVNELRNCYTGDSAEGWNTVINTFSSRIGEYQQALTHLKDVVHRVAGSGGDMNITDKDQGSRFHALQVP